MLNRILRYIFYTILALHLALLTTADTTTYKENTLNKQKWEELSNGLDYDESDKKEDAPAPEKKPAQESDTNLSGIGVLIKYIGFALIIGIIGFVCASIITSLMNKNARIKNSSVHITREDEFQEENIAEWPLQQSLNKYMHDGDIRNAIRIYYLMSLQLLHLNGLIKWEKDKTNSKYLMELSAYPGVADFSALTTIYETTWYGKYIPDTAVFSVIKTQFAMFNNQFPAPDVR